MENVRWGGAFADASSFRSNAANVRCAPRDVYKRQAIATPAVIAHVYYSRKLERISASMEVLLTELISFRCHHSQR